MLWLSLLLTYTLSLHCRVSRCWSCRADMTGLLDSCLRIAQGCCARGPVSPCLRQPSWRRPACTVPALPVIGGGLQPGAVHSIRAQVRAWSGRSGFYCPALPCPALGGTASVHALAAWVTSLQAFPAALCGTNEPASSNGWHVDLQQLSWTTLLQVRPLQVCLRAPCFGRSRGKKRDYIVCAKHCLCTCLHKLRRDPSRVH